MRVMKNKTLFESFQENLKEIDSNVKKLTEDTILWSSDLYDDYADWSDEDFINQYKEDTGEEPESLEQAMDYYIGDDDSVVWDAKRDDLQTWVDEFQQQTTDDIIIMSGNVGVWTGNHSGGKVIKLETADDLLTDYDSTIRLKDEGGNVIWECAHHDGTHYMGLYGLPKDEEARIKLVTELGIVDWLKDIYNYESDEDALSDALEHLTNVEDLENALSVEDYGKLPQYCPPIKSNVTIKESALEPQFAGRKSFYGKADVREENGWKILKSYSTDIVKAKDGQFEMITNDIDDLTQTTLRHVREFLQQEGITPPTKSELVKMIQDKDLTESDETYGDKRDADIVQDIIDNFQTITGVELNTIFNYENTGNDAEGIFKQDKVEETSESIVNYLKGKGLDRRRIDDLLYVLDEELASLWNKGLKESFLGEQDQTVRVVTNVQEDRDYTITDITELNQVADGDVQPPIDITGLLNEVDARLNESVGNDWGVINYQSTRFNVDTKDSNALFELCVGDKTYLMSMLLEENGSLLKVNNTKGQTIFKRKSNDMVGLAESYIKQFIPKKEKENSYIIKHMNNDLHSRLEFIKSHIKELKSAPKEDKEAFRAFIQNEIYSFVAELSGSINKEEPNDEETSKLPTFDDMVKDVFGKEWVKVPDKENKLELDGVEELKEEFIPNYAGLHCPKCGSNEYYEVDDDEYEDGTQEFHYECKKCGYKSEKDEFNHNDLNEAAKPFIKRKDGSEELTKSELRAKWKEAREEGGWSTKEYPFSKYLQDIDDTQEWELVHPLKETNYLKKYPYEKLQKMSDKELYKAWLEVKGAPDVEGGLEEIEYTLASDALWDIEGELCSRGFMDEDNNKTEKWSELTEAEVIPNDEVQEEPTEEVPSEEPTVKDETEPEEVTEPLNGLGTGYAKFARKASDINDVDVKADSFTAGESSYVIVSKEVLSADEFDKLTSNLLKDNEYCKKWEPIDTENYSFNVIEFSCPDYDYKLLVDPSGFNYCRYVAKVQNGGNK